MHDHGQEYNDAEVGDMNDPTLGNWPVPTTYGILELTQEEAEEEFKKIFKFCNFNT